ncbi:tryptophan synthase alpha chain [Lentzea sp. NBRC 105346]|uniref:tryptophan synthase subunit alpha n=1 Tax=Lentzea sp. NBRC 105346 TaxID=3032205 RepID=UPI0024A159C2|nr:tryptophan synthase subunit alpha [Lentzea sp. NBRC 105346]GLZ31732.1 tryptophan synthase alpha chain [Lentzea sp. NBRC 105346]
MSLLAPYVTGGITPNWTDYLLAARDAGADMIEIGLPFSDPTLDGPTIQEASDRALARGATVDSILADIPDLGVPLYAMTYANLALRKGFCASLRDAGITGLIVPDVPLEELAAFDGYDIDVVLLASPSTRRDKRREIAKRSSGFVYAVSLMGTTGEQEALADAQELVADLKEATDLPVMLGFGISGPEQAAAACRYADGVVVGSAIMRRILDGATPKEVGAYLTTLRTALN